MGKVTKKQVALLNVNPVPTRISKTQAILFLPGRRKVKKLLMFYLSPNILSAAKKIYFDPNMIYFDPQIFEKSPSTAC